MVLGADHHKGPFGMLLSALAAAEDAASRADERIRSPLGEGLKARLAFQEACAWSWNRGEVVHLEDLVLNDEGLDIRLPDQELTRTRAALRQWRRAEAIKPAGVFSAEGVRGLITPRTGVRSQAVSDLWANAARGAGLLSEASPPLPMETDGTEIDDFLARAAAITTEDNDEALDLWFGLEQAAPKGWPGLLRAAVMLEAWIMVDPLPGWGHLGGIVANALLQRAGRLKHHRLHVEIGRRRLGADVRRPVEKSGLRRVIWQLRAIAAGEALLLAEHDRLSLARQVLARSLVARRSSSRLSEVVEMFTDLPVVTASMIAHRLKVSQQSARSLVGQLGAGVTEITGRARYQAWRL